MAYAPTSRPFYDADSHIMELPDFLQKNADPALRAEIPAVSYAASIVTDEEVAEIMARGGRHSEEHLAELIGHGDHLIERVKEIQATGLRRTWMCSTNFRRIIIKSLSTWSASMKRER